MKKVSVIIPCYNESENVVTFYDNIMDSFNNSKYKLELIFVNDGSKDDTIVKLKKILKNSNPSIKVVDFSRNFGKEAGMYAGLKISTGDYAVIIDADMQQPPKLILEMLSKIESDDNIDIVAYYQEKRIENPFVGFLKSCFYKTIKGLTNLDFYNGASDFRLMKRSVVDTILSFSEQDRFTKGLFAYIGFNTVYLPYVPSKREHGKTSWNLSKLLKYSITGIYSFMKSPMKLLCGLGIINFVLSLALFIILLCIHYSFSGIAYLYCFIIFMFSILFVILGFISEFIFRSYNESRNRPIYISREVLSNEKNN